VLQIIQIVIGGAFTKLIVKFRVVLISPSIYPPPGVSNRGSGRETVRKVLHLNVAWALDLEAVALAGIARAERAQARRIRGIRGRTAIRRQGRCSTGIVGVG
jgi:hypothetical protein